MSLLVRLILVQLFATSVLGSHPWCPSLPSSLSCEEDDCSLEYANSKHQETLKSDILKIYREGRSAQGLFQRQPKPHFHFEEIIELLLLCIEHRKFHSFEYIVENLTDKDSKWFGPELHKAIVESPFAVIFTELLPVRSIHTSNKVDLLLYALSIPNVDVLDCILSDSNFLNFRRVTDHQWAQIFTAIGVNGSQSILNKLLKNCTVDLRRYSHIHVLAAAEHGNYGLVQSALEASSIYQYGMKNDLAIILVRKNQRALFTKMDQRFDTQLRNTNFYSETLLITAIQYASYELFELVLSKYCGPLAFVASAQSLAIAQADLHNDLELLQQLKGLDLEGHYPLPLALAASLGHVDKLYALQYYSELCAEPRFDALELLEKFYPLYSFNMKYSQLSDPMQISLFYNMKHLSPSFQEYIGAFGAACRGSLDCLMAFYEHEFCIPPNMEYTAMMTAIRTGHVDVFEFILEHFSTTNLLCESPEVQRAVMATGKAELLGVLLGTWPPVRHDIMQSSIDGLDSEGLERILTVSKGFIFSDHLVKKAFDHLVKLGPEAEKTLKVLLKHFKGFAKITVEQLVEAKNVETLQVVLDCGSVEVSKGLYMKALKSRDLEIVRLVRTKIHGKPEWASKALYTSVKLNFPDLISLLLEDDLQLQNYQMKIILKAAASLPSSKILSLLTQDKRFAPVVDHHDLLGIVMKKDALECFRYLLPPMEVNRRMFRNALRTGSNEYLRAIMEHPSMSHKKKTWWKKAAYLLGKLGNHEALSIVLSVKPILSLQDVLIGAESRFRLSMIRHLLSVDKNLLTAIKPSTLTWLGGFLYALRVFDLSLIGEALQDLRLQDPSLYDLVLPQLDSLFLECKDNIVMFSSAPIAVQQSRKAWYDYRPVNQ